MKTFLVIGASRGIGAAVAQHLLDCGHRVIGVSRSKPAIDEWIQADVSTESGIASVAEAVSTTSLDGLLFLGGVWEKHAFTEDFRFEDSSDVETRFIIAVNLVAPIELTRRLVKNLALSTNPRAIYIGSLTGLDQSASAEVANTASKFGLRGAIQALRLAYRSEKIGFTVINPGNVATAEVLNDIKEGRFPDQDPIPLDDVCRTIDWLFSLSPMSEVGDINLIQKNG